MKAFIDQYLSMILGIATLAILVYIFRKKIFSGLATGVRETATEAFIGTAAGLYGKTPDQIRADVQTVRDTSIKDLASDIWTSLTTSYMGQDEFRRTLPVIVSK